MGVRIEEGQDAYEGCSIRVREEDMSEKMVLRFSDLQNDQAFP